MAFSELPEKRALHSQAGLYLRNLHGGRNDTEHAAFRVELFKGGTLVPFTISASPTLLHLTSQAGNVDIFFADQNRIRLRATGVSIRFLSAEPEHVEAKEGGHWEFQSVSGNADKYMFWALTKGIKVSSGSQGASDNAASADFVPDAVSHQVEGLIETYDQSWSPSPVSLSFSSDQSAVKLEYRKWLDRMPRVSPAFGAGAELAAYVNWSSVVAPMGFLDRPTMLMSKNWMAKVWAWDHCFNAMALSLGDPDFAWQQFMIMFDNQLPSGALPDTVTEAAKETKYSKPPIHGWALTWMMAHGGYSDRKHLAEVYEPLEKWTEWYFHDRDQNHDGLPEYNSGPDSGWDNSTVFLSGAPVETPELSSYLVLQMYALSQIAHDLGKEDEAKAWAIRSNRLLQTLLAKLWRTDHFVAIRADNGAVVDTDSLELYMPLVLGKKLPVAVRKKMIAGLTRPGRFRTSHGFASEALTSKYYVADGYWLGPIWAPNSMLLAEGLDSIGQKALATKLRLDFCRMVQQNGISENFDAKTGVGLRDPAYTWTSSVYLVFSHQLWEGQ